MAKAVAITVVGVLGMIAAGQCKGETFKECYAKCFIFCMIEPSQNLCSCTTRCLKDCIFPDSTQQQQQHLPAADNDYNNNLDFCKLGCAFFSCSTLSTNNSPNGKKVEDCVGSCSNVCTDGK